VSDPSSPSSPDLRPRLIACAAVAVFAFLCYRATLLPGLDFGDTASYQAAVGDWRLTPRQAYPLYYAVANSLFALTGGDPAWSLNLTSALAGAAACGVLVWVVAALTGSLPAALWAGLSLGASYTFWSQAIIGEVYTLHLLLTGLVAAAALWWRDRPGLGRLAVLFGIYALGFGNHLMMVLLVPPLVLLVLLTPGGLRQVCSVRGLALAAACALLGAAQYLWNAAYLWQVLDPAPGLAEGLRTFWFDVTKSDWRSTMVLGVHETALKRRLGLYWFDLRQQVGPAGVGLALIGLGTLVGYWRWLIVLLAAYLTAVLFAYTYNVGDVHVFFLPSHQVVVVLAACGVAALIALAGRVPQRARRAATIGVTTTLLALPLVRWWDTWPAVDRHDDRRPQAWLDDLTLGLGPDTVLLADINWQLENGLDYYTRHLHPELNVGRASDHLLSLPLLVRDNLAAGRTVAMTPDSRGLAEAAYGPLFVFAPDPLVDARPLPARLGGLPPGAIYVLTLLAPYRDLPFDAAEAAATARALTGGTATLAAGPSYQVLAGRFGEAPAFDRRSDRPFRESVSVGAVRLDLRMESWLPADTIRRAGFGHVVANRRHALTMERGLSLVVLDPDGRTRQRAYASGLLAPLPRWRAGLRPSAGP
jgi:Protein of unknown function (DUF2723)